MTLSDAEKAAVVDSLADTGSLVDIGSDTKAVAPGISDTAAAGESDTGRSGFLLAASGSI